jgi:PIN domain nuclease of toxin-antitoxin system
MVIDTHVLIWWLSDPARLGRRAARALKTAKRVALADVSLWELAMLEARGRIALDRPALEWLQTALRDPRLEVVPLTPSIAVQSTRLGALFHPDPADRLIVATAMVEAVPLLTADARIRDWGGVPTLWD